MKVPDEQIQQIAELRDIDRNPLCEFGTFGNVVWFNFLLITKSVLSPDIEITK